MSIYQYVNVRTGLGQSLSNWTYTWSILGQSDLPPKKLASISIFALLLSVVRKYADPQPFSGACNIHDPAVIQRRSDGVCFRFVTGTQTLIAKASSLSGS